jgi:hypothetical protein
MKLFIPFFCLLFYCCEKSNDSGVNNIEEKLGCLNVTACNHDANATVEDGSCLYDDCAGICGGISVSCPNWEDNPGLYENIATFAGAIIINNIMNEGDMFAAFDLVGNVRGVAVQLMPPFGPYQGTIVYEMQIRSNDNHDLLSFKYYDASEDMVLDVVETYEFMANDILGDMMEPFIFHVE